MHYEVHSDRPCAGNSSGEVHRVVRCFWSHSEDCEKQLIVAVCRRRDMAEDLCGEFNKPKGVAVSMKVRYADMVAA
jgi:hypothetical protein